MITIDRCVNHARKRFWKGFWQFWPFQSFTSTFMLTLISYLVQNAWLHLVCSSWFFSPLRTRLYTHSSTKQNQYNKILIDILNLLFGLIKSTREIYSLRAVASGIKQSNEIWFNFVLYYHNKEVFTNQILSSVVNQLRRSVNIIWVYLS